jgi:hypothetical protein
MHLLFVGISAQIMQGIEGTFACVTWRNYYICTSRPAASFSSFQNAVILNNDFESRDMDAYATSTWKFSGSGKNRP